MSGARVVDASVVAAFAFREARRTDAQRLLADGTLHAPGLLRFEVTNVAWLKTRRDARLAGHCALGLRLILAMRFRWEPVDHAASLELALDRGLTGYDASYLWLAWRLGLPLVTFDRRLAAEAGRLGLS